MLQSQTYLNNALLPHLKQALDEDLMRHHCRALLGADTGADILSCRVTRLRYRRAQRCIIQYEMTLKQPDDTVHTHWLAGYQYADKDRFRARARRQKRLNAICHPADGLLAGAVIDEIGLLLERFPFDRRIPALAPFYTCIEQVIGNNLAKILGSQNWLLKNLFAQPVRWRIGLSSVIQLTLLVQHKRKRKTQRCNLYLKIYAPGAQADPESGLQGLESVNRLPFKLPHRLMSDPQQKFSILKSVEGLALDTMLLDDSANPADARRLAGVLARWHSSGKSLGKQYSKIIFNTVLNHSVEVLCSAAPACASRLNQLAEKIRRQMVHAIYCPAHLDLKPEHIIFNASQITLIDIDSAADADPMIDIALLYARLRHADTLHGLPEAASRRFGLQFVTAYHKRVPSHWWNNFSTCYAWALLKMAVHLFESQHPDWAASIEQLLEEAELSTGRDRGRLPLLFDATAKPRPGNSALIPQQVWFNKLKLG